MGIAEITLIVNAILAAVIFRNRRRVRRFLARQWGRVQPPLTAALTFGWQQTVRWFRRVRTIFLLTLLPIVFLWVGGLTYHRSWMIGVSGGLLLAALAMVWFFAEAVAFYFGTIFRVARATANLTVRAFYQILANLRIAGPGPVPEFIGDIRAEAVARLRSVCRTLMIIVGVYTGAFVLLPAWSTYATVGGMTLFAVTFILMAAEWGYETRVGKAILAKSQILAILALANLFVLQVAAALGPDQLVAPIHACGVDLAACGAAAFHKGPFPALILNRIELWVGFGFWALLALLDLVSVLIVVFKSLERGRQSPADAQGWVGRLVAVGLVVLLFMLVGAGIYAVAGGKGRVIASGPANGSSAATATGLPGLEPWGPDLGLPYLGSGDGASSLPVSYAGLELPCPEARSLGPNATPAAVVRHCQRIARSRHPIAADGTGR